MSTPTTTENGWRPGEDEMSKEIERDMLAPDTSTKAVDEMAADLDHSQYWSEAAPVLRALAAERDKLVSSRLILDPRDAELEKLRSERDTAISTLNAWFDRRKLAKEQIDGAVKGCVEGYLRRSRSGGMPKKISDQVSAVIQDMVRLGTFADLFARHTMSDQSMPDPRDARIAELEAALLTVQSEIEWLPTATKHGFDNWKGCVSLKITRQISVAVKKATSVISEALAGKVPSQIILSPTPPNHPSAFRLASEAREDEGD